MYTEAMCRIPVVYCEGLLTRGGRAKGRRSRISLLSVLWRRRVDELMALPRPFWASSLGVSGKDIRGKSSAADSARRGWGNCSRRIDDTLRRRIIVRLKKAGKMDCQMIVSW